MVIVGGRGRPDPFDTWMFVGNRVLNPDREVPLSCKIHLGCPSSHIGWKKWAAKDVSLLPGADLVDVNVLEKEIEADEANVVPLPESRTNEIF